MEKRTTNQNDFLIYSTPNNEVRVDVLLQNEMLWLSQKAMSFLFGCSTDNVSLHLKNIFESEELEENAVVRNFRITVLINAFSNCASVNFIPYKIYHHSISQDCL